MDSFEKYYIAVIKLLTRRPRSEKEIFDYLLKKKATPDVIRSVVKKVQEQHFQSDLEFARWWVQSRTRYKAKSNLVIKMELRQKGINDELIQAALTERTDDYKSDSEKAEIIARKYIKRVMNLPKTDQYRRLTSYLSQKGFDYDTIRRVIDDIL